MGNTLWSFCRENKILRQRNTANPYSENDPLPIPAKKTTFLLSQQEIQEMYSYLKLEEELPYPCSKIQSALAIPLLEGKELAGMFILLSKKIQAFPAKQMRLFETITSQLSLILQNVKMYEETKALSLVDDLTSIYNRRFFYLAANKESERAKRYAKALSLILIDIDHFKRINDRYGHVVGDEVLQKVTHTIQKDLRTGDIFSRYGGEEFLILLPETSGEVAVKVAERIRESISNLPLICNTEENHITLSIGVTQLTSKRDTVQALISAADEALYQAKQKGRNRVTYIP